MHLARTWVLMTLGVGGVVAAQEPDWQNMPISPHSAFQAVAADGFGTFPLTGPARLRGILVNRPQDMLKATAASPGFMGGTWQVFLQAADVGDWGGTALWMGQYIGKIQGNHPAGSYSDAAWVAELDRIGRDGPGGRRYRPGDLVEVRARAPGLFFRGKTNVNEQHSNDLHQDFDLVLLQAGAGMPPPADITLSDLKDASDVFLFDATRTTGPERYQGTVVRIPGVEFVSAAGWGPEASLTVTDGSGRTLPVLLGRSRGFRTYGPPAAPFDVVGLLDQEDTDDSDGWMAGYRLWVMGYDGQEFVLPSIPGDTDCDDDVDLADFAWLQVAFSGSGPASPSIYFDDFDFDFDGDVDEGDATEFLAELETHGGPNSAP